MALDRTVLFRLATSGRFERGVRAAPPAERLARRAAGRYVAGETVADALRVADRLHRRGVGSSLDQFGEQVGDAETADRVADDYVDLAAGLATAPDDTWLSIDLSHLGLDLGLHACADRLARIADRLPPARRLQVGAEDHGRADAVLDCVLTVAAGGHADRLGATVQANLHRSARDLEQLVQAGVHVRLVKGAYVETTELARPYGEPTDVAYIRLAHELAAANAAFSLATHDRVLQESLLAALGPRPVEQLLGVRPELIDDLVARGSPVRVYVPFGANWFRYWMRRVAESRGA
jgi:proline dehydrogenase